MQLLLPFYLKKEEDVNHCYSVNSELFCYCALNFDFHNLKLLVF